MEYISVSFKDKDDAKMLGAKWDPTQKQWYIPTNINAMNKRELQEKYKSNDVPIIELLGEDRTFGGNELFVDLIPSTCWFTNVRYCIHPCDWDRVRRFVYKRVNYICEGCGINTRINNIRLDAHERWSYDLDTHTQKLVRLVALCADCHQSTHYGLAEINGKSEEAFSHLQATRHFTEDECHMHIINAFDVWLNRSKIEWTLDLSLIENNNIRLANKVNKEERNNICNDTLSNLKKS
jgi:hypothetical protein